MKQITTGITLITMASLSFFSCKKDRATTTTTTAVADTLPTRASLNNMLDESFYSMVQSATFDASNTAFTYTSPKGTTVTLDGTCLRRDGAPVTGLVTLDFFEAYENKDMLIANKPTMGRKSDGTIEPLQTGGQFYIGVTQRGKKLTSNCGVQIVTKASNSGGTNSGMKAFDGTMTDSGLIWTEAKQWEVKIDSPVQTYRLQVPDLGWYNCDRFYLSTGPKTKINIICPKGYEKANIVYLYSNTMPGTLGLIDYEDGLWPVGTQCYLIFVTEKDKKYRWIMKKTTLVNNHTESFDMAQAQTGTLDDFKQVIKNMP